MADSLQLVQSIYDAFSKGDVPTVIGAMDEKIEWHEAEHWAYWTGRPYIGPQAVLENVFAPLGRDFDGFHVNIRRLVSCSDTVLAELRYRGTVKKTGRALEAAQVMGVTPQV